ncbi:hypothetical protein WH96_12425 [Kiloniella spongiae]|uniref:DUF3750 domain-containing protein n=1 Tax=Kiloniella spongiae TaxID=1489064 RepID=A0A0H2MDA0_9PROT|nr:DUF3750 domain-containing protein [Kiloniella spongiae]KLN60509.1 hypothetical protein WH96_12425 [Kiloniella spongiae]
MKYLFGSIRRLTSITLMVLLMGPFFVLITGQIDLTTSWNKANHDRAGIAPDPVLNHEAIVQIYGARTFNWRGAFAIHTWVAFKEKNAREYTRLEVIGWRHHRGLPVISISTGWPDRNWFGSKPEIYYDLRGKQAAKIIPEIINAANTYRFADQYKAWPGPNSNTFTAHVIRQVSSLNADLPPTAIGKDYLDAEDNFLADAPSNTGMLLSLYGLLGVTLAKEEGLEINILGLNVGVDPNNIALRLPGIGKVGFIESSSASQSQN